MASSDKNLEELKSLVVHTLETNGVLGQIRAQLRANVYKAIDNDDDRMCISGATSLHKAAGGQLMAEIVADFMEHYELRHSLSVFLPEAALAGERRSREKVAADAGVPEAARDSPLLARLLEVVGGAGGCQGGDSHHVPAASPKSLTRPAHSAATTRASTADGRAARAEEDSSPIPDAQEGASRRRKLSSLSGSDKDFVEDTASKRLLQLDQQTSLAKVGSDRAEVAEQVEELGESILKLRGLVAYSLPSRGDTSDVYVVARAGKANIRTAPSRGGQDPVWLDGHDLTLTVGSNAFLELEVMSTKGKDVSLGKTTLDISGLKPGNWRRHREQLKGARRGELEFELCLTRGQVQSMKAAPTPSRSAGSSPVSSPGQSAASSPVASSRGASRHHRPAPDAHDDANSSVHSARDSVSIEGSSQSDEAVMSAHQVGGHRGSSGSHGTGGLDEAGGLDEDSIHDDAEEDVSDYAESHEAYEASELPLSDSGDKF